MTESEHLTELLSVLNLCALARRLKITDLLRQSARDHATLPHLHPVAYRAALTRMQWQDKCVETALLFQTALDAIGPAPPIEFQEETPQ